ncbi:MAG TPA: winged helix-turn-helix domain-containing protein [Rhodanobacteraceae bacterium]
MNLHAPTRHATDALLSQSNLRLRIGEHVIDVGALRLVTRPDLPRLTHKAVAVLIELVRHVGTTVTRDELLDRVWVGRLTTPDVLTQVIKELRRAFADDSRPPQYIETIPKVGYRLIAPVLVLDGPEGGIFVGSDGVHVMHETEDSAAPDAAVAQASKKPWWVLAAALALLGVTLAVWWQSAARRPAAAPVAQPVWKAANQRTLTSYPGPERRPNISPDGTRIAFGMHDAQSNFDRIFIRSVEDSQLIHLTVGTSAHETLPWWSPDGTRIAFERLAPNQCSIFVASNLGGGEREVGPCGNDYIVNYYDWTPDGKSLITAQSRDGATGVLSLMRWSLDTGEKQFLDYPRLADDVDLEPHYSPDGRWIAFRRGLAPYSDLYVMAASNGTPRQVTHFGSRILGFTWARDSRTLVLASNYQGRNSLYAVDMDGGTLQPLGITPAEYPVAARGNDSIVYEIPRTRDELAYVPIRGGAPSDPQPLSPSTGSDFNGVLSPAGDRIVFVSDRSGQIQLWLYDRTTSEVTALTHDANVAVFAPRWSSDGTRVVAIAHGEEGRKLVEVEVATQRQRVLSKPDDNVLIGAYGVDPDSYLIGVGTLARDDKLLLVTHPGSADEARRVLATSVAYLDVDPAARLIYYTGVQRGLFSRGFDDGDEARFVTPKVTAVALNGWRVVDHHIWYMTGVGDKPAILHEIDPANGQEHEVARLNVALQDINFSVTPQRDGVIVSQVGVEDTDVGMFDLVRTTER